MEERLIRIELLLGQIIEQASDQTAAAAATYAAQKCLISSLIGGLKVSGVDLRFVAPIFFESATEKADSLSGEQRRVFLEETKRWVEFLHSED